jgi:hypothetical protein
MALREPNSIYLQRMARARFFNAALQCEIRSGAPFPRRAGGRKQTAATKSFVAAV